MLTCNRFIILEWIILNVLIISNTVNLNRSNPYTQKLFGVLKIFLAYKGTLRPNHLRTWYWRPWLTVSPCLYSMGLIFISDSSHLSLHIPSNSGPASSVLYIGKYDTMCSLKPSPLKSICIFWFSEIPQMCLQRVTVPWPPAPWASLLKPGGQRTTRGDGSVTTTMGTPALA